MKKLAIGMIIGLFAVTALSGCKSKRYRYKGPSRNCDCPNGQFNAIGDEPASVYLK